MTDILDKAWFDAWLSYFINRQIEESIWYNL